MKKPYVKPVVINRDNLTLRTAGGKVISLVGVE